MVRTAVESDSGLGLRARDAASPGPAPTPVAAAAPAPEPLSAADLTAVLARLPALPAAPIAAGPSVAPGPAPPARTGATIVAAFPPPIARPPSPPAPAAPAAAQPLTIVRTGPRGDVDAPAQISITFSQPMIALSSHAQADAVTPATLRPALTGAWRWLDSRTIVFEPKAPFPRATTFEVEVPAGVTSATGAALATPTRFRFQTAAPRLESHEMSERAPGRVQSMVLVFDQRIDPAAALEHISIEAGGGRYPVRFTTLDEVAADESLRWSLEDAVAYAPDRFLVVRPVTPLPGNLTATVTIAAGMPSAEGPRTTAAPQSFTFETYPRLRLVAPPCPSGCEPGHDWQVGFSNPLAEDAPLDGVRVEPAIAGQSIAIRDGRLVVAGATARTTSYQLTLPATLRDVYGQTLAAPLTVPVAVGDYAPALHGPGEAIVLDPAAPAPIYTIGSSGVGEVRVQLRRVTPADWSAYAAHTAEWERSKRPPLPGRVVLDRTVALGGVPGQYVTTDVDLGPALTGGLGHVIAVVEPITWPDPTDPDPPALTTWVQVTRLGLATLVDHGELIGWATDLATGRAVAGATLELLPYRARGRTGADGIGRVALPKNAGNQGPVAVVRRGADSTFVTPGSHHPDEWRREPSEIQTTWFVFDDRGLYRPGEEVHLKGWVRRLGLGEGGDVALAKPRAAIAFTVTDRRGEKLASGTTRATAVGGFDLAFAIPAAATPGRARVELSMGGDVERHHFEIGEFRRPEYEVSVRAASATFVQGDPAVLTAHARYYTGAGLGAAPTNWQLSARAVRFSPPHRDEYVFGTAPRGGDHAALTGTTDPGGEHRVAIEVEPPEPTPISVTATAAVIDVNRQRWTDKRAVLIHPADVYVGLRTERFIVPRGQPLEVATIAVDLDGAAVSGRPVTLQARRSSWVLQQGEWTEVEADAGTCAVTSAADAVPCRFATPEGGRYEITASVRDARGRENRTQLTLWVPAASRSANADPSRGELTILADRASYAPGDVARILVQSPHAPVEGLLSLRRGGITRVERFRMTSTSQLLEVPIRDAHTPNLFVDVDVVGDAPRANQLGVLDARLPRRPYVGHGSLELAVPPRHRRLAVQVTPAATEIAPGATTTLAIDVRTAAGAPARAAEVAVVVVDEAILALTAKPTPDPLPAFYPDRERDSDEQTSRELVELVRPELFNVPVSGRGGLRGRSARVPQVRIGNASAAGGPLAIDLRADFSPLAVFAPAVRTDARGKAVVTVALPDNLTRYRVMAVAAHGAQRFGSAESAITARLPLMVRPSPPRFLNTGDELELPVVVHNDTDQPLTVDVGVRASNLTLPGTPGRRVAVPARDRVEVRFPAAAGLPGTASIQVAATTGALSDGSQRELPILTPATREDFATYGVLDAGATVQPVAPPAGALPGYGGLSITTSATELQALTDAVLYLEQYPFDCSEQLASRLLAVTALRDVLAAFAAAGLPPPGEIDAASARDLALLRARQHDDGGFGLWSRDDDAWPYFSVHVAHALVRARAKGLAVAPAIYDRALAYLTRIEAAFPKDYPIEARRVVTAYALYVRRHAGRGDSARARALLREAGGPEALPLEAVGWLLGALAGDPGARAEVAALVRLAESRASETAGTATFAASVGTGAHLIVHSSRRTDAVLLEALIDADPSNTLIPKLVRGLLAQRTRGRWISTQENVFILLALGRYFEVFEKTPPAFTARAWLGPRFAGEHSFAGHKTERHRIDVPLSALAKATQDLTLSKTGPGRMYYRVAMTYAPADRLVPAAARGFTVTRRYEPVDDAGDVTRRPDGTWVIRAGARVRVRVQMIATAARYHVALIDPLPAGLEAQDPDLVRDGPRGRRAVRAWFEHRAFRDTRVEAFATSVRGGEHTLEYLAIATTPGRFVAPPARAEEMYFPETFGRAASDVVVVEP